jgi:hypothetical protein
MRLAIVDRILGDAGSSDPNRLHDATFLHVELFGLSGRPKSNVEPV